MSIVYAPNKGEEVEVNDKKLSFPAAIRNGPVILEQLQQLFPAVEGQTLKILEIGSGSGQHVQLFAKHLPHTHWQPSDVNGSAFESIRAYVSEAGLEQSVEEPIVLDASQPFPDQLASSSFDGIELINILHIAPWSATIGVLTGSAKVLKSGGKLVIYGPFAVNGVLTPQSNVDFDLSLRQRNSEWGVRDLQDITNEAKALGLVLESTIEMPSNNYLLVYSKT